MTQKESSPNPESVPRSGKADGPLPLIATDLGLVAFLHVRGLTFDIDRSAFPTRFNFRSPTAEQLAQQYWDRAPESLVPAQTLIAALHGIKSQIFRRGHNPGRRLEITDGSQPPRTPEI